MPLPPYTSVPIINALVIRAAAQGARFDKAQAMLSGILNYYFPISGGFLVAFSQDRYRVFPPYFYIRRMGRSLQSVTELEHYAMVLILNNVESEVWTVELLRMLQTVVPEHRGCWVIIFDMGDMKFFKYHHGPVLTSTNLIPFNQSGLASGKLNVQRDDDAIDRIFGYILQNDP
ncbi:uncharacterized protein N7482_003877 [Penicillium canariense]|uniref:Uncharacterized protein n=1 Tax=Penicillium canariense TaxID=189055 RepID=A0A9W9I7M8_9EURO|nr:uncharacterized protein N7482_003877 [Penicillium canariense]KAJ5168283.1 hypothetical protein N7482_003877 [Penicillium canariense]